MTRKIFTVLISILFTCSASMINAQDAAPDPETNSALEDESLLPSQLENQDQSDTDTEAEQPEGDDDFVPSAQISEDLSVSFPVDI